LVNEGGKGLKGSRRKEKGTHGSKVKERIAAIEEDSKKKRKN
jgi:hypothetical protein